MISGKIQPVIRSFIRIFSSPEGSVALGWIVIGCDQLYTSIVSRLRMVGYFESFFALGRDPGYNRYDAGLGALTAIPLVGIMVSPYPTASRS